MGGNYVDPTLDAAHRERFRTIAAFVRRGDSSVAIAHAVGLTRQRVCQIIGELGLHDRWLHMRAERIAAGRLDRITRLWRPERRVLADEAKILGYTVGLIGANRVGVEGLEVHACLPGPPWVAKVRNYRSTHPGYYRWAYNIRAALYVVVFPEGGRLFALPPHQPSANMQYLRADDPATTRREPWPSREALQRAAAAVHDRKDRERGRAA